MITDTRPETITPRLPAPQCADPNCSSCGGSGEVTDPDGNTHPCIQCSPIDPGPW